MKSKAWATLRELGDTKEEVYKKLRKLKIRGLAAHPSQCPIANYLKKKGFVDVVVGASLFSTKTNHNSKLPKACVKFIEAFDSDKYPDLEQ